MLLRASKKRRGDVSLSDPVGTDKEGRDISFRDILGTPPDMVEEAVHKRISLEKIRLCTVIALRYGFIDGKMHPQHEVAAALGISRSYISRIEMRAVEMLREKMDIS